MKYNRMGARVVEHLVQPFSIPVPGQDRTFLASGFCEADETTTIFKRAAIEGDSDVCSVECSVCGGPVITHKDSSELTSTFSPEIVGCLIQKDKTLLFVLEKSLSQSDSKMVKGVILQYLARHDFTASFHQISVYQSGVNSSLKKQPPKRNFLFSQKLKSISGETLEDIRERELQEQEVQLEQDKEDKLLHKQMVASAKKLLKEPQTLFMPLEEQKEKTNSKQTPNSVKTLKHSRKKLSKADEILLQELTKQFLMNHSIYD